MDTWLKKHHKTLHFALPFEKKALPATIKQKNDLVQAEREYRHSVSGVANESLRALIKDLIVLKKEHALDDDQFSDILEIVLARYIENEVSTKVGDVLSGKIFRIGSSKSFDK